jgi:hypothetical protein
MRWDYLVERLPNLQGTNIGIARSVTLQDQVSFYLNQKGAEGWELVQIASELVSGGCDVYDPNAVFIFKRPRHP